MSWKRLHEDEPELYLVSTACDYATLSHDLATLVRAMVVNRAADGVPADCRALHFFTNATNGYVRVNWRASDGCPTGTWSYTLEAEAFWKLASEHPEGAFHFDNEIRVAIACLYEDATDVFGEEADLLDVFTATELLETEQLFI